MNSSICTAPPNVLELFDIVESAAATVARRLPTYAQREDLLSVGKIALIEAVQNFSGSDDECRAYCYVRVRGAMLDELRRQDPMRRANRDLIHQIDRIVGEHHNRHVEPPNLIGLSQALGVSSARVAAAIAAAKAPELDWESLSDENAAIPNTAAESSDLWAHLCDILDAFPASQAKVLRGFYIEELTLTEIASEMGISVERARQIRESGVKRLREQFKALGLWQVIVEARR